VRVRIELGVITLNCRIRASQLFLVLVSACCLWSQTPEKDVPAKAAERVHAGNVLYDKGSYDEAVKEYESAIALAPNWYEPHYELGQTYYQMKRTEDAKKQYDLALESDPECWLCYQGLGNLADDLGDQSLALRLYQKAVNIAPDQGQPHYNVAVTFVRLKRIDEAIAELKEAQRLRPEYASPYFLLGKIYHGQQKFYLAFDQLFRATKLEKSGPRFDQAKKLTDVQVVIDNKLDAKSTGSHMSYCLARAGSISPEEYRKRFPGAETYLDNAAEEEYVLGTFATIVGELSQKKGADPEFASLVAVKKAGHLTPFILSSTGDRFVKDLEEYEKKNPGRMNEFRKWASENKISLEPLHPRCEVHWMGQTW
jgi:tetratricopeptide (TPR) repeat protein